jgi:hypothetical protein
LEDQPEFIRPELETSENPIGVTGPFDFAVTEATEGKDTPSATLRKILVPGPDGELREIDLPFFAAGKRLEATADSGLSPWISAAIAGALVLAGAVWLLIVRARQRDLET